MGDCTTYKFNQEKYKYMYSYKSDILMFIATLLVIHIFRRKINVYQKVKLIS